MGNPLPTPDNDDFGEFLALVGETVGESCEASVRIFFRRGVAQSPAFVICS